ncbi:hypothetical protein ACM8AO_14895 [Pseudomonas aeruginosa]
MTKANECTCPSGDGSLRHPCPAHPASVELAGVGAKLTFINGRPAMCGCQVEYSSGGGEYSDVIDVTLCAKHSGSAILDLVATNRIALTPEYEGQWHADFYLDREIPLAKAEGATPAEAVLALMSAERIDPEQESVEQAGGDERAAFRPAQVISYRPGMGEVTIYVAGRVPGYMNIGDTVYVSDRAPVEQPSAALAQPSPVLPPFAEKVQAKLRRFYDCASDFESGGVDIGRHWLDLLTQLGLLNRVQRSPALWEITQQGEDLLGTPQPSPAQADEKPGDSILCYGCFAKGVGPEHFDEAGKCLVRQQLDPLNLAQHAEEFNEAPAEALKPEQAKAERLDWSSALLDVAVLQEALTSRDSDERMKNMDAGDVIRRAFGKLKEIRAQHDRIVGELRAEIAMLRSYESERELLLNQHEQERDAALAEVERLRQFERICEGLPQDAIDGGWTVQGIRRYAKRLEDQLKVALARVAELEKQEPVATVAKVPGEDWNSLDFHRELQDMHPGTKLYAAPVAQAQPEETPGEILAAKLIETWVAKHGKPAPWSKIVEITALATNMPNDERDRLLALDDDVDAQAQHSVPRAWLDVQAERRRHVEVEGYHGFRDSHYINYELSKAARAYIEVSWHALSGGLPCKQPESWPWMAGFKWSDGRTMLVKACALTLAEIERLDRAAAPGKEGV